MRKFPDVGLLKDIPLFKGLDSPALEEVIAAARSRQLRNGSLFFRQDETATAFYVLIKGRVKVAQVTPEGQQVVVRFITPGQMFGCVSLFGDSAYPASAVAIEESRALSWDVASTARLLERHPRIAMNALKVFGTRLREMKARFRELTTERVERRVAHAILRLARQAGKRVDEGVRIEFLLSRQDLAEMTGTTLYTVSRILTSWERKGLVTLGRQRITIRKPHGLVAIAEDL